MERSGDEGYKTMEFVVTKEKQEFETQLKQVRRNVHWVTLNSV